MGTPPGPAAVVLTATIDPPPGAPGLARSDPEVRRRDYEEALRFYLALPDESVDRVLLLENSGADLGSLERIAARQAGRKRVELLGFQGNDHPAAWGKGYGEFRMLDHGLSRNSLVRGDDLLWKVTGRLRVLNLPALARSRPPGSRLYCDLRHVPLVGNALGGNRWMDLRVFACTVAAYDVLFRGHYPELRSDRCGSPEFWFFDVVRRNADPSVTPRFRVQPRIAGFGGHRNVDYQGPGAAARGALRAAARRVAPWLWV